MSGTEGNKPDNTTDISTMEFSEKNLFLALSNDKCMKRLTDVNISYLYNYLTHLKCSTIVTEAPYVDRDFLDDYCSYYVRCFRDYSRFCKRVHFFSRFDVGAFGSYLDGQSDAKSLLKKLNNEYLGYVVAKPLPSAIVGRTVLRLWEDTVTEGNDELGKRSIRCVRSYTPNLAGLDLKVRGLAFQEQDRVLAACATSALWSAFHRTAEAFDHPIPSLYEITMHATKYYHRSRPIPSEGLSSVQMCHAIREVGLEPELIEVYSQEDGKDRMVYNYPMLAACYGYLRFGIPVILAVLIRGTGIHAVTLAGYRVGENVSHFDEMKRLWPNSEMRLKGSRVVSFYAQDDQIGPYSRLTVQQGTPLKGEETLPMELGCSWKSEAGFPTTFVPLWMILPLYRKIRVPFMAPLHLAHRMQSILDDAIPDAEVEWDVFLSSVNEYKREISMRDKLDSQVRKSIVRLSSPRFFWRARAFDKKAELCELLVDATDMEPSFQLFAMNIFDTALLQELGKIPSWKRAALERDGRRLGGFLLRFIDEHFGKDSHS